MTPEDKAKYDQELTFTTPPDAEGFPPNVSLTFTTPPDAEGFPPNVSFTVHVDPAFKPRRVGDVLFNAPQTMVTDPKTGGQKGSSLVRPDLLPVLPMAEVAFVFGRGALKYASHNWRRGYDWSLSVAALERHLLKWKAGQSYDPEGFHHLGAVVFHALALMEFENNHPDRDDRFKEI